MVPSDDAPQRRPLPPQLRALVRDHMDWCGCRGQRHEIHYDHKTETWYYSDRPRPRGAPERQRRIVPQDEGGKPPGCACGCGAKSTIRIHGVPLASSPCYSVYRRNKASQARQRAAKRRMRGEPL